MRRTPFRHSCLMRAASAAIGCSGPSVAACSALTALSSSRSSGGKRLANPARLGPDPACAGSRHLQCRRMGGSALDGGLCRGLLGGPTYGCLLAAGLAAFMAPTLTVRSPGQVPTTRLRPWRSSSLAPGLAGARQILPCLSSPRSWLGLSWRLVFLAAGFGGSLCSRLGSLRHFLRKPLGSLASPSLSHRLPPQISSRPVVLADGGLHRVHRRQRRSPR